MGVVRQVPKRLTSGAKALIPVALYGTTKAVPFVRRVFPQRVKAQVFLGLNGAMKAGR
jgi:hypothetical protein